MSSQTRICIFRREEGAITRDRDGNTYGVIIAARLFRVDDEKHGVNFLKGQKREMRKSNMREIQCSPRDPAETHERACLCAS